MKVTNAYELESISPSSFTSTLPFIYRKGVIILEVLINNKKKLFILDSGARTSIDNSLLEVIQYKSLGYTKSYDASGQKKKLKNIQTSSIAIKNVKFQNIVSSVMKFDNLSKRYCLPISGIIGYNILSKLSVRINFEKKELFLFRNENKFKPQTGLVFDFSDSRFRRPLVNLKIGNIVIENATLDLGSNGSISLPYQYFGKIEGIDLIKTKHTSGITMHKEHAKKSFKLSSSKDVSINGKRIPNNVNLSFEPSIQKALIGTKFLENYIVTIDGLNKQLTLYNYSLHNQYSLNSFGITIGYRNSTCIISSIIEESVAFRKGIRLYDEIIKINDDELSKINCEEFYKYIENNQINKNNHLDLIIQREGEIIELALKK